MHHALPTLLLVAVPRRGADDVAGCKNPFEHQPVAFIEPKPRDSVFEYAEVSLVTRSQDCGRHDLSQRTKGGTAQARGMRDHLLNARPLAGALRPNGAALAIGPAHNLWST